MLTTEPVTGAGQAGTGFAADTQVASFQSMWYA